jgi:hypothetical protein
MAAATLRPVRLTLAGYGQADGLPAGRLPKVFELRSSSFYEAETTQPRPRRALRKGVTMPNVRGYIKRDGTRVTAHWRRSPSKLMTVAVSVVVGGTAWAGSSPTGAGTAKSNSASRGRSSKFTVSAEAQAGFKRAEAALSASGYKASLSTKFDTDCATHSYGLVHEFLAANPCKWLARAYVQIGDSEVLVAISWVGMPNTSSAESYKRLVDTSGAGNVTELSRETKLYRKIQYAGSAHASGIHGTAVWNVQVKPVFPRPNAMIGRILIDSRQ